MSMDSPGMVLWIGLMAGTAVSGLIYLFYRLVYRENPTGESDGPADGQIGASSPEESGDADVTDLQSSMSASPDAVLLTGGQWQLRWANDTACQWFGVDLDRDKGRPIRQVMTIPGFDQYISRQDFADSFECDAPADGTVRLGIRVAPYRSGQYLLQGRDITRFRQLEQIRRDFVANASHELRTPLSILYGYLEMMQDDPDNSIGPQWKPAVRQMFEQTTRIKQIIDDMMLLSRLEEADEDLEQQYTPMAPVMHSARQDAEALTSQKHQSVLCEIDENYSLYCNFNEIQSMVTNLIANAVRYTPEGGSITIKWKVDLLGGSLSVEDTGIGIEEENIPRLTERFYRTDSARSRAAGGTGLGLAIVNHIVNRHNAKLFISSKVGKGSMFTVLFPRDSIRADHEQVKLLLN